MDLMLKCQNECKLHVQCGIDCPLFNQKPHEHDCVLSIPAEFWNVEEIEKRIKGDAKND